MKMAYQESLETSALQRRSRITPLRRIRHPIAVMRSRSTIDLTIHFATYATTTQALAAL
jgi:hypothetical protein